MSYINANLVLNTLQNCNMAHCREVAAMAGISKAAAAVALCKLQEQQKAAQRNGYWWAVPATVSSMRPAQ